MRAHLTEKKKHEDAAAGLAGRVGEAESEKRRGEAEVDDLRNALWEAKPALDPAHAAPRGRPRVPPSCSSRGDAAAVDADDSAETKSRRRPAADTSPRGQRAGEDMVPLKRRGQQIVLARVDSAAVSTRTFRGGGVVPARRSDASARLERALAAGGPVDKTVAETVRDALDARAAAADDAEKVKNDEADAATREADGAVSEEKSKADAARAELDALGPRARDAERAARDVDAALKPLRRATDESVAAANAKVEKQKRDLEAFRREHGAGKFDETIRDCEAEERRLADELDAARREQRLLEVSEDEERELSVLDHAAARAAEAFGDAYGEPARKPLSGVWRRRGLG